MSNGQLDRSHFCSSFFVGLSFPNGTRAVDLTPTIQVFPLLRPLPYCFALGIISFDVCFVGLQWSEFCYASMFLV